MEPRDAAFLKAYGTELEYWQFIEQPERKEMRHRFGVAMGAAKQLDPEILPIQGMSIMLLFSRFLVSHRR